MANLLFSILSTFNDKGLKKATKQLSFFEKQTKSLQATFLKTFSAIALLSYSKKAVDAFAKDQAAAKALETQLKNTGYQFSAPNVEYYIANLEKMTGVLDDHLRPAFQMLLTSSGSLTRSQKALAVALDVSAATGRSVEEVSQAMAKGFSGQTTALSRLGAGLSKATLATNNMDLIMAELQDKFSGQAKARLETYAGKMDLLRGSAARASETIGKGLLDSLTALGKNTSITDTTKKIEGLATAISNLIVGLGVLGSKLSDIGSSTGLSKILSFLYKGTPLDLLTRAGAEASANIDKPKSNFTYSLGSGAASELAKIQELKARKALVVQLKAEESLRKLKDKYDVERIGLMAALNFATDEETKLRISEKLAILDGNAARASEYLATRNAEQALEEFAKKTETATTALLQGALYFRDWVAYRAGERGDPSTMSNVPASTTGGGGSVASPSMSQAVVNMGAVSRGEYTPTVVIELAPNAGEFGQLIYNSFLQNQREGKSQLYNGGIKGG